MLNLVTLAAGADAVQPRLLGFDAEGWVYWAITIFFVIAFARAKVHRKLLGGLDARIADTRKALDEASAIRAEAEALLVEAQRLFAASTQEAASVLQHARHEAEAIVAKAARDTDETVARRAKMATDKISSAERAAVEMIRARAGNAAIAVATDVIAATHDVAADRGMIAAAIAGI